jgi:hypothetical protein
MVAAGASFSGSVAGIALRVHSPWRLIGAGALAAGVALLLGGRSRVTLDLEAAWDARESTAPWVAASAAVAALVTGLACGTWTAGSADAYGYVSQALHWVRGTLVLPQPLAAEVPWPMAEWTFSPLGYRPAQVPGSIVPAYPPGLPLTMAGAALVAGPGAIFTVVPVLGALAVWFTFVLGRRLVGAAVAASGAVLLAASPVFLYQLVQPMSDVPVTAWWVGALAGAWSGHPLAAGLLSAAAAATRPNLAPLAGWIAVVVVWEARRRGRAMSAACRDLGLFGVPVAAAAVAIGVLHTRWYGHPLASGYGSAGELYAVSNVGTTLGNYASWLTDTQTPLVWLALLAPALWWRQQPPDRASTAAARPGLVPALLALGFSALVLAAYLPYSPFSEWSYLRFLLPGLPIMLLLAVAVLFRPLALLPAASRIPLLVLAIGLGCGHYVNTADRGEVFNLRGLEARYPVAGAYAARQLPATAVLFSVQESGALRLYSGRTTLRFDHLPPDALDGAVAFLQARGYHPFFALEAWEEDQFRSRFSASSPLGALDWPPVADVGGPVTVRFYDPRDRARFLAGETVSTFRQRGSPPERRR